MKKKKAAHENMAGFEPFYPQHPRWIAAEDEELRALVESGFEIEEIVERLNRPISGIQRRCRMLGLEPPSGASH